MTARRHTSEAPASFSNALAALEYAARLHAGQRRRVDGAPFILHPLEVGCLLYHADAPDHVIAAGFLHDTIEKTDANAGELRARFGLPIATLVLAVCEDERIVAFRERKAALREQVAAAGREALMIFAADKISNVRQLRLAQTRTPRDPDAARAQAERLAHYRDSLIVVEQVLIDSPLVVQLRRELEKCLRLLAAGRRRSGSRRSIRAREAEFSSKRSTPAVLLPGSRRGGAQRTAEG